MGQFSKFANVLPRPLVKGLRNAVLAAQDLRDRFHSDDELVPPRSLHFVGGGDFKSIGKTWLGHFVQVCSLGASEVVLDIGCGTGRMAVPLLDFLDTRGAYVGFDISRDAIGWCRKRITQRNPRFSLVHADIGNLEYNPGGKIAASSYTFPCETGSIDFAFATSVFTHLRAADVRRYLAEVSRVLKVSGRALLTFYIVDDEARNRMRAPQALFNFDIGLDDCLTIDRQTPERAIAYSDAQIAGFLREAKLTLLAPVFYGSWSGRPTLLDVQDAILVAKSPD